jgi:hypothetical protein
VVFPGAPHCPPDWWACGGSPSPVPRLAAMPC